jgi:hypothetical protein
VRTPASSACKHAGVTRRSPIALFVALATVALVAGCGGSGNDSSTTTASEAATQWANGLCAATTTYTASLRSMGTTLKSGGLNKQTLDAVVSDAKASTQAFADSVESLGAPPVSDSKGKQIFETLHDQLADDADAIKSATENVSGPADVLNAISSVAGTLARAGTQISDAFGQVKQLDADDTVRQAFSNAPACDSLTGS